MSEAGLSRLAAFCSDRLALASPPQDAAGWLAAGQRLHAQGEGEAALAAFEHGVALAPQSVDAWMAVATLRSELGRSASALAACNEALKLAPENADVLLNTGLLLRTLGDLDAALFTFEKAIRFGAPAGAAGLARAQVLAALQRLDPAAEAFAACLAACPDDAQAAFGLADVELARANFERAAEILQELLARFPEWTAARISLAVASVGLGDDARADALLARARRDDAAACAAYRPFFAADQFGGHAVLDAQRFRVAMEFTALFHCRWEGRSDFERWMEARLLGAGGIDDPDIPFVALGLEISPPARLELARKVARRIARTAGSPLPRRRAMKTAGKIRLGYLSGDMRDHPIGRLLSPIFGLHDRRRFEVYLYHTGPYEDCPQRRQAESGADVFRDAAKLTAGAVAAMAAADGIDILVDLSGYTMFNRAAALALRPAPVQVAYLGYLGTSGAEFVDYAFADRDVLLPEVRPYWSESIAYLPDSFFCCDDRLAPPPRAEYAAYLQRYRLIDLVLDTFAYTGNTTTVEALAMGVPVLTRAGVELQSRVAAGLLRAHGLPELVARDGAEYEAIACSLAGDPAALAALRDKVAANRSQSRLFCSERRVREMERAYEMMWERHRRGLAPADFDVPPLD